MSRVSADEAEAQDNERLRISRAAVRAGLRCDEKPQYTAPPLQPNNDDVEADDGRRRSAQDLSHLLPLDTGEGETRPGVAHLQISTHPPHPSNHTLHTTGSRRRLTATASLAERRNDSAAPARLATPLATDSKRIRWTNPPAVGTSSQRRREGQPVVTGRRRLPPSPSCSLPVIALQ